MYATWHKESYFNWKIFASVDDDVSHFCTHNHNKNSWGSERKKEGAGGGGEAKEQIMNKWS